MTEMHKLREAILAANLLDEEGSHHQFASGTHGRKIDFDLIVADSELYALWVEANVNFIKSEFGLNISGAVGVANGTNRIAIDVARGLSCLALTTKKLADKSIALSDDAQTSLGVLSEADRVIVLEDVGTSGGSAVSVSTLCQKWSPAQISMLFTWQRTDTLPLADQSKIPYWSIN